MIPLLRHISLVIVLATLWLGLGLGSVAQAEEPDLAQIVTALTPQRSTDRSAAPGPQATAVSLVIGFDGNSHRLTLAGMKRLRTLAGALQDPSLRGTRFEIIGHAVVPGQPTVALPLSSRRAQAVAGHLTAFYDIDVGRFASVRGVGAEQMQSPNASDPRNQRIEFINIGRN